MWSTPRRPVPGLTGALADAGAVAHPPLRFDPGSRWSYSNEGYIVLAAVIERLSGEMFHDYLRRQVFAPAGMTETVLGGGPDDIVPHRAVGYRAREDDPLGVETPRGNWSFIGPHGASGAGGGNSTAPDRARFGRALREGVLVSDSLREQMWPRAGRSPGTRGRATGGVVRARGRRPDGRGARRRGKRVGDGQRVPAVHRWELHGGGADEHGSARGDGFGPGVGGGAGRLEVRMQL